MFLCLNDDAVLLAIWGYKWLNLRFRLMTSKSTKVPIDAGPVFTNQTERHLGIYMCISVINTEYPVISYIELLS